MQLLTLSHLPLSIEKSVVTIGMFDGVHLAHQHIMKMVSSEAQNINAKSVVITFWPHPKMVITGREDYKILSTLDEKIASIEQCGIDYLLVIPFDKDFAEVKAIDFLKNILIDGLHAKKIIIGYDHHFGKNREGNFEFLMQHKNTFHFQLLEIDKQESENATISSSTIRQNLQNGEIEKANLLLGKPYSLRGKVVQGFQMGRKLGFPTANINLDSEYKLVPAFGVYAVKVFIDQNVFFGVMNIGNRPTFDGQNMSLEVHIVDFEQDIYSKEIKISFLNRIRSEKKFENIDLLKAQIAKDIENAKGLFSRLENKFIETK